MAAATFVVKNQVPQGRAQLPRRVEFHYRLDFSVLGDGTGLAATEDAEFADLPAGYVHERLDAVLRTAQGVAATVDIGSEATPNGFLDGGNVNGNANAAVALAGTEAFAPGTYFHVNTPVRAACPAAAATLDAAVLDVTFVGYLHDTE